MLLKVENNGPEIIATNYWESPYAGAGAIFLSLNAGAFRLLLPDSALPAVRDMQTAKDIIISIGPWPKQGKTQAIEILFDDHTDAPFSLHCGIEQIDRMPADADSGREFIFIAYQRAAAGPQEAFRAKCYFRKVPRLPCLKPWKNHD